MQRYEVSWKRKIEVEVIDIFHVKASNKEHALELTKQTVQNNPLEKISRSLESSNVALMHMLPPSEDEIYTLIHSEGTRLEEPYTTEHP